jgi:iron complex outermembrane receptor protein
MKPLYSIFYVNTAQRESGLMRFFKKTRSCRINTFMLSTLAICSLTISLNAQQQEPDSVQGKQVNLNEVIVSASRASDKVPVTYSQLERSQIQKSNLGQDIPVLLNFLPSVVATTFDGTGVGYTDYRIRGADNSRINVTINGIPYNDADSQTTFFVNLQDFASSIENIQVQRGVGTSTNGAGAFGASINILTDNVSETPFGQISSSIGTFWNRSHRGPLCFLRKVV